MLCIKVTLLWIIYFYRTLNFLHLNLILFIESFYFWILKKTNSNNFIFYLHCYTYMSFKIKYDYRRMFQNH